jgi:hypothetical protein
VRRNGAVLAEVGPETRSLADDPPLGQLVTYQVTAFGPGGESPGSATNSIALSGGAGSSVQQNSVQQNIVSGVGAGAGGVVQSNVNAGSGGSSSQLNSISVR